MIQSEISLLKSFDYIGKKIPIRCKDGILYENEMICCLMLFHTWKHENMILVDGGLILPELSTDNFIEEKKKVFYSNESRKSLFSPCVKNQSGKIEELELGEISLLNSFHLFGKKISIQCKDGILYENEMICCLMLFHTWEHENISLVDVDHIILPDLSMENFIDEKNKVFYSNESRKSLFSPRVKNQSGKIETVEEEIFLNCKEENVFVDELVTEQEIKKEDGVDRFIDASEIKVEMEEMFLKRFICEMCSYTTNKRNNFNRHKQKCTKEFRCDDCNFVTTRESVFKKHKSGVKRCTKDFKCSKCSYETGFLTSLQRHEEKCLTEKPEKCLFCSKGAPTKDALRMHMKRHHKEDWEKYQQEISAGEKISEEKLKIDPTEKFTSGKKNEVKPISEESKAKLQNYKRASGMKVPCEVCGLPVRKDHMNKHLRGKHQLGRSINNKSIFPKVSCNHCDMKISAVGLRKHLRISHNLAGGYQEEEVECNFCLSVIPLASFEHHVRGCFVRFDKASKSID